MTQNNTQTRLVRGFTLLELMVALTVAAILLTVAVPAFNNIIQSNAVTVARNSLIGALSFTRSEAVKQGRDVILCKSADGLSCSTTGDWSQGWIVYARESGSTVISIDNLLRVQTALDQPITITGNSHVANDIEYDAMGFAYGENGTLTIKRADGSEAVAIIISNVGRVRVETP